eukprot:TRINITY_DN104652_c0_g1_i1.p1 TRINITY_DN104652_c0_g1~~TRINITY_DN104652_c0_g1_i1.p1  ORF type:complete len:189 (-),score=30.47 TRINITY_DN104652_c0_g1_i1:155-721(-)
MDDRCQKFSAGAAAIFSTWTALRLSIDNSSNPNAEQMATDLQADVIDWFVQEGATNEIMPDELQDFLESVFDRELHTDVEDGSIRQVSEMLCSMFKQCFAGDYTLVTKALQVQYGGNQSKVEEKLWGGVPIIPGTKIADDDEDEPTEDNKETTEMEEDGAPAPKEKPKRRRKPKPQADADGWTTVGGA